MTTTSTGFAALPFATLVQRIAARTPTPGGGTGAALAGALGAALGCMAVRFSTGKKAEVGDHDAVLAQVESGLMKAAAELAVLADEDAAAFESVRTARKLPQSSPEEKAARAQALAAATCCSADVPLQTAKVCREAMECLEGSLAALNARLATDAGSGALLLRAGARSAAWNVLVNLVGDVSPAAAARRSEVSKLLDRVAQLEQRIAAWTDLALVGG
ncbi:MAG: methenyltetrahydrofolate cyclohydrolase [Planctomycetes bacterium]|nr:methenyltetrahydrofolate cyclohydrolase [Planctomycetota bacterium]